MKSFNFKMWCTIYLILALFFIIYLYFRRTYNYWKSRGFPYIKPKFPFGNLQKYILLQSSLGDSLADLHKSSTEPYVGFWVFGKPCLLLRSPEIIKKILAYDFNYFCDRTLFSNEEADPVSANFLLLLTNPKWKHMRKSCIPLLCTGRIKKMIPLMEKCTILMIERMMRTSNVNITDLVAKYTGDMISSCILGYDSGCFKDETTLFHQHAQRLFGPHLQNALRLRFYYFAPYLVNLFKIKFMNPENTKFFKNLFWDILKNRQVTGQRKNDIIDACLQKMEKSKKNDVEFNGTEMMGLAIQMFGAGYETIITTISSSLLLLSTRKHIQEEARNEVNSVFSQKQCFDYESLRSMKYLDRIIAETLRMYPPLNSLDRRCMSDYKLPDSDLVIEKGTAVYVATQGLHYDHNYFQNPNEFNPDRFNEKNIRNMENYTYLPFGEGPRNCIGKFFGNLGVKICLAYILKEFVVEKPETLQEEIKLTQTSLIGQPMGGINLHLLPIN